MHNLVRRKAVLHFFLFCGIAAALTQAQSLTTLASFNGGNGQRPAAIVQATDGNFYGVTAIGGSKSSGAFFQVTPAGTITALYSFAPPAVPTSLMLGKDGNFYGTTQSDGSNHNGTIFKVTTTGTFTTLYQFDGTHGANPLAALTQGADGNFYGVASLGGANTGNGNGFGTVFRMTPAGAVTTIYSFAGPDGNRPTAALVLGSDGNFYGTTEYGGTNVLACPATIFGSPAGCGTVFKITPAGALTTLYNFSAKADGAFPQLPLIQGSDGSLYGTTNGAGFPPSQYGSIFKITTTGTVTTLADLGLSNDAGAFLLSSALVQTSDGTLYGLTAGTLFKISASGTLTNLYAFCSKTGCTDGSGPDGLILGADGNLYGTTLGGGSNGAGFGTVFKWTLVTGGGTPAPAVTLVANAEGGESPTIAGNTWVEIKGTNLSQTQRTWQGSDFTAFNNQLPTQLDGVSVMMNGIPAYVYFISKGQINVLTPINLGTGAVQVVVTTNGLPSNSFQVQSAAISPSFFVFDGTHIIAEHLSGAGGCAAGVVVCLVGPSTLISGQTTPAASGETIILFMNGFGKVDQTLIPGALTQSGSLTPLPTMTVAGLQAQVTFAGLISPGLFQFNVTLPKDVPNGDAAVQVQYQGQTTPAGAVLTILNPPAQ